MKMKSKFIASILLILSHLTMEQGLNTNDFGIEKVPLKNRGLNPDSVKLPASVDLSIYCPSVRNQGNDGTCVGWSTGYYMRTILEAKRLKLTDKKKINQISFSANYLYNSIKENKVNDCSQGTDMSKAFEFLKTKGNVKYTDQDWSKCQNDSSLKPPTTSRILDYSNLFELIDRQESNIISAKKALAEGSPIVVGIITTPNLNEMKQGSFWDKLLFKIYSFFGLDAAQKYDHTLWKPAEKLSGGHAICVVGYDDNHYDGAFYAINSYGAKWGNNGFFWIKYTDFGRLAKYGYQAFVHSDASANDIALQGEINFDNFSKPIPFTKNNLKVSPKDTVNQLVAYTLTTPQKTGTGYTFKATLNKNAYLYLISASSCCLDLTTKLFPNNSKISALISANTELHLPADSLIDNEMQPQKYTIGPPLGTENWLFLFSEKEIDADDYAHKIAMAKGNVQSRILKVFGNELVPFSQIIYQKNKKAFILKGGHKGSIVPLLINFEQVSGQMPHS